MRTSPLRKQPILLLVFLAVAMLVIAACQRQLNVANRHLAEAYQQRYMSAQLAHELRTKASGVRTPGASMSDVYKGNVEPILALANVRGAIA